MVRFVEGNRDGGVVRCPIPRDGDTGFWVLGSRCRWPVFHIAIRKIHESMMEDGR